MRWAAASARASDDFSIVAIGASEGGLEATTGLLDALPSGSGLALILVQHRDTTRDTLTIEMLSRHTSLVVQEVADGLTIERDHLYVVPPGFYLSVAQGVLHLSRPEAPRTLRRPFDFLLQSLAPDSGTRTICVVLSGTGSDGSDGLKAVKDHGGLVVVQDPDQAAFDGMPRSAIMTGAVDLVLPVAEIAEALPRYHRRMTAMRRQIYPALPDHAGPWLTNVVDILRAKTGNDFGLHEYRTLQRRIERRMAMAAIEPDGIDRYLEILRSDSRERELLAKDLLISVTRFFRDPTAFNFLARKVLPDLIDHHASDQPLRVWIAGCGTGEEAYSIAILLREAITAAKRDINLQIVASDVDTDAVATAREGLYPRTIEAEMSSSRLARFFSKEKHGYRVVPALRDAMVFTVQDVLSDPPSAPLDLISCRNLLSYLTPEAKAKVIATFHFALRSGGILILGTAETPGDIDGRYEMISKTAPAYRRIGGSQAEEFRFSAMFEDGAAASRSRGSPPPSSRQQSSPPLPSHETSRAAELEHELVATRIELQEAIRKLEDSTQAAVFANQERDAESEDIVNSNKELRSLNEELAARISQLQEELDRLRTISDDIQNAFYGTDISALFLDTELNIRFFTPATRSMFGIIPSDIGRPLADFRPRSDDPNLLDDAAVVLQSLTPIEREIDGADGTWHIRRAVPYRTRDNKVAGVVITFTDITERKRIATALEVATQEAKQANVAKSRFLAAANHDLRQPLQTLALIQGILARTVEEEKARRLLIRQDEALSAMSDMLNRLLDINHIDAGTIHAEIVEFPINDLLDRLRREYNLHAEATGLILRVLPCSLSVASDPRLLEEIIRNLLSNALKYTKRGKVLVGCRRHKEALSIEVWDTGVGIPEEEQRAIFGEYHRIDNPDRDRTFGLGLGLSIVQLLADVLDHRIVVNSQLGKGSMFAVEVALATGTPIRKSEPRRKAAKQEHPGPA